MLSRTIQIAKGNHINFKGFLQNTYLSRLSLVILFPSFYITDYRLPKLTHYIIFILKIHVHTLTWKIVIGIARVVNSQQVPLYTCISGLL